MNLQRRGTRCSRHREARHRIGWAPHPVPSLLPMAFPAAGRRLRITDNVRVLIRRLAKENSDWGAPKIHVELQYLSFVVCERSVAQYLRRIQM
jgi:hypothetical protein